MSRSASPPLASRRTFLAGAAAGGAAAAAGIWSLSGPGGRIIDGRSRALAVSTLGTPPSSADVVIIGGGIIGVAAAFELARRGASVTVCEKGVVAGEASGRSVGDVTSGGLDPVKMELLNRAKELWRGYNELVGGETGYRANGHLEIFQDSHAQRYWEEWLSEVRGVAPNARLLGTRELANHVALDGAHWLGAYYDPTDGCAEPTLAAPVIAKAAIRHGARIVAPCAVRGIETEGGRVAHVITEKGAIRAKSVVLAGGCWSALFAGSLGLRLPAFNVFSMCRTVAGVNDGPDGGGALPQEVWRRQIDGNYTISVIGGTFPLAPSLFRHAFDFRDAIAKVEWDIHPNLSWYFLEQLAVPSRWKLDEASPFERVRILEPTHNLPLARQAVDCIQRDVPAFRSMALGEVWSGALVATPDNMPTISAVPGIPGLFLGTGFTYGLTMAPAAGEAIAQLVLGEKPVLDLHPYRYERYIDGSRLRFAA